MIRIVEHLIAIDTCVCGDIDNIVPFSQSTLSRYLNLLKEAGIACGEVQGPRTCFCVDRAVLNAMKS